MTDETKQESNNCLITGKCTIHDVEIERRRTDRKDMEYLKAAFTALESNNEQRFIAMHNRVNRASNKVIGIFVSLGLIAIITFGGYYYTSTVDRRNNRGEEILLARINADSIEAKNERSQLASQVVALLTADAEQEEWRRGVMTQLELFNTHIRDILELKHGGDYPIDKWRKDEGN